MLKILGLNAYHGDSSACLVIDGVLINAIEEERIRRIKHWAGLPTESIKWCLSDAEIQIQDVDYIAISRNPSAHLHKKILRVLSKTPSLLPISTTKELLVNFNLLIRYLAYSSKCATKTGDVEET